jgi:hypothetical protein
LIPDHSETIGLDRGQARASSPQLMPTPRQAGWRSTRTQAAQSVAAGLAACASWTYRWASWCTASISPLSALAQPVHLVIEPIRHQRFAGQLIIVAVIGIGGCCLVGSDLRI